MEFRRLPDVEAVQIVSFISPRLWLRQRRAFRDLRRVLAGERIVLRVHLMPAALAWGWPTLILMTAACAPTALLSAWLFQPTVIHSRTIGAAWLAHLASKALRIPHVFDPRGPIPDEMAQNDRWPVGSLSYRWWKRVETLLVRRSDAVVGVTPAYRREHIERGARRAAFVPNRCDTDLFRQLDAPAFAGPPLLVFTGEMDSAWYSPEQVGRHFLSLRRFVPNLRLRLITRRDRAFVSDGLRRADVPDECWELCGVPPDQVPAELAGATCGLVIQNAATAWPVKFAEFLALGVPVVLSRREGGDHLADLIVRHRLGMLVDMENPDSYAGVVDLLANLEACRKRCAEFAHRKLGIERTARQHHRLYRSLAAE